jgi:beta-alanine--pyruvate transaminase
LETGAKPGLRGYEVLERLYHEQNIYVRVGMDTLIPAPPLVATESQIAEMRDGIAKIIRALD